MCSKAGIDHPETFVHKKEMGESFGLPFGGPFIVKPSNGVEYWEHSFPEQKKVFKLDNEEEVFRVLGLIYASGYKDSVIIQNFIPGDDSYMRVLTNYSDKDGKVQMMCLGHVLLEEHTPRGIGNHAVIITEHNGELENTFKRLLENIGYTGFSNLDLKYDKRDGKYKVFEINVRQGRSNYYVTNAGENIARYLVEDYIDGGIRDCKVVTKESLWLVIPKRVAFSYVAGRENREKMKKLIKEGNCVNPLDYSHDKGLVRRIRFIKSQLGHFPKYRKYLGKEKYHG
jgi:D-aspartate ligase